MKTLILMRHAKSAWGDPHQKDIDRPLSARGRKAAPRMGEWLAGEGYRPDVVLCSTAARVRDTLELLRPHLPPSATVEFTRGLYMAEPREMLTEIGKVPATAEAVMLIQRGFWEPTCDGPCVVKPGTPPVVQPDFVSDLYSRGFIMLAIGIVLLGVGQFVFSRLEKSVPERL